MDILSDFIKVDGGVPTLQKCKPIAHQVDPLMLFLLDVDVHAFSLLEIAMHFLAVAAAQHRASRLPFYTLTTSWHSPGSSS